MRGRLEEQAWLDRATRHIREPRCGRSTTRSTQVRRTPVERCPSNGAVHELGSGGGYLRDVIPDAMTLHVLPYPGIENIVDGLGHRVALGGVSGCSENAPASI